MTTRTLKATDRAITPEMVVRQIANLRQSLLRLRGDDRVLLEERLANLERLRRSMRVPSDEGAPVASP